MKFKIGDLIAEYTGDSIYLIVLTRLLNNQKAHGYMIDSIHDEAGEIYNEQYDKPIYTMETEDNAVDLNEDVFLIQREYTSLAQETKE